MKTIKFRAFIPKLNIYLEEINIGFDGMIGCDPDYFEDELPEKHEINDDGVYLKDFENGNDIFEEVISILSGDEWMWIEEPFYELQISINGGEFEPFKINQNLQVIPGQDNETALKNFVNSIALYKENDGQRELTAIKLSDFEKLKELYNKIKF